MCGSMLFLHYLKLFFHSKQSYVKGDAQPPGYYKQSFLCETFRILNANAAKLNDTIERHKKCEEEIESLSTRLEAFSEHIENRYQQSITSSNATMNNCSNYKIFDQDIDPTHLPSYFRTQYEEHKIREQEKKDALLIDIESRQSLDGDNACDQQLLDDCFGGLDSSRTVLGEVNVMTSPNVEMNLPPPLAPEVISTPTHKSGNNQ